MATNSSILAWKSPLMEEPGSLQSLRSQSRTGQSYFTFLGTKSKGHRVEYKTSFQSLYSLMHAAAAKLLQWCPTLFDPIDSSPPGSAFPGILQARTLKWVAIFFSNAWKWKVKVKSFSRVRLLETPWSAAHQAPPSMGFSRQEYCSGVPLSSRSLMRGCLLNRFNRVWLCATLWTVACHASLSMGLPR